MPSAEHGGQFFPQVCVFDAWGHCFPPPSDCLETTFSPPAGVNALPHPHLNGLVTFPKHSLCRWLYAVLQPSVMQGVNSSPVCSDVSCWCFPPALYIVSERQSPPFLPGLWLTLSPSLLILAQAVLTVGLIYQLTAPKEIANLYLYFVYNV